MTLSQIIPPAILVPVGAWAVWGCVRELRGIWRGR